MMNKRNPLCGADLERWRLANGLTKATAADAFGLQIVKWDELTDPRNSAQAIADPTVAMLLQLYQTHPESSPVSEAVDMSAFYEFLGLVDNPRDREKFAALIGRSAPSAYRLLLHGGKPGRPLTRLVVAVRKLGLPAEATLSLMTDVAGQVGERQGCPDVLANGWKNQNE